jgi:hypothetical protein
VIDKLEKFDIILMEERMKKFISIMCFSIIIFANFFGYSKAEAQTSENTSDSFQYKLNIPLLFRNHNSIYQKSFSDYDIIDTTDGEITVYTIDQYQGEWTYDSPNKTLKNYSEILFRGFVYTRTSVIEEKSSKFIETDYIRKYNGVTFIHCDYSSDDVCDATTFKYFPE